MYRDNARDAAYRRNGWFLSRGSYGFYTSTTRGRVQTLTSQLAAPPSPPVPNLLQGVCVPVVLILGALLAGGVGFAVALVGLIAFALRSGRVGQTPYEEALTQWGSTFRCGRCGTVFTVVEQDAALPATRT